jgi:hypothetical protein
MILINSVLKKSAFPIPRLDDTINCLGNKKAKVFTTVDISQGFWAISIEEASQQALAFNTGHGLYQFKRLPYGLTIAPALFCEAFNNSLQGLIGACCLPFVDDIIIWATSNDEMFENLGKVLDRMIEWGFRIKVSKSKFFYEEVEYLAYIIGPGYIRMAPDKIQTVTEIPPPNKY